MTIVVIFTVNGKVYKGAKLKGQRDFPPFEHMILPNDVHIYFVQGTERAKLVFQKNNGDIIGEPHEAPENAKDIDIEFVYEREAKTLRIKSYQWSVPPGEERSDKVDAPVDDDGNLPTDIHLKLGPNGRLEHKVGWTKDGSPYQSGDEDIPMPGEIPYVNDFHFGSWTHYKDIKYGLYKSMKEK